MESPEAPSVPTSSVDPSTNTQAVPAEGAEPPLHGDIASDAILGDVLADSDSVSDLGDLHAALLSLSDDAFAYLDVALDHLTSSSDLFDVPSLDHGDVPDHGTDV